MAKRKREVCEATSSETTPATTTTDSASALTKSTPASSDEASKIEALREKKKARKLAKKEKRKEQKQKSEQNARELQQAQEKLKKERLEAQKAKEQERKLSNATSSSSQDGFKTIRLGVQYKDIVVGKGPPVQDRKKVRVSYTLRAKNRFGKVLDTSNDFRFRLGRGEVIQGWDLGVQGMRQGGRRFLIVPPEAGYGRKNIGAGVGGILFFDVTVVAC